MTYMTLAAKYRTSAAGRAAMQEKDLIPALVNWYDKVLQGDDSAVACSLRHLQTRGRHRDAGIFGLREISIHL